MARASTSEPRFSYDDYVRWTGDERWELIDGVAHLMSPSPSRRHQDVVVPLLRQIANALEGRQGSVYVAPLDVRLARHGPSGTVVDTVVQPDLAVICDPSKLDDAGCLGAPDWIIEVTSPSTSGRDRVQKRDLYERHGVREYWCVDPWEASVLILRLDPETERFADSVEIRGRGQTSSTAVTGVEIDWSLVFPA